MTVVGDPEATDTRELLPVINRRFMPEATVILKPPGKDREHLSQIIPALRDKEAIDGKATVYVCKNYSCQPPATTGGKLDQLL